MTADAFEREVVQQPADTIVVCLEDRELVEVQRAPAVMPKGRTLPTAAVASFADLFREVPRALRVAGNMMVAGKSWYLVKFAPEVTEALRRGTSVFTPMAGGAQVFAIARARTPRFPFAGNPLLVAGARSTAIVMAAWEVLALITAQKYLSDIQRSLEEIKAEVEKISEFQRNELLARIASKIEYLRQVEQALRAKETKNDLLSTYRGQLEAMEREWLQDLGQLESSLAEPYEALRKQRWSAPYVGSETLYRNRATAIASLARLEYWGKAYLCVSAFRVVQLRLRMALGLDPDAAKEVLARMRSDAAVLRERVDKVQWFVRKQIPFLRSHYRSADEEARAQHAVDEKNNSVNSALGTLVDQLAAGLRSLDSNASATSEIAVCLDQDGKLLDACELVGAAA